MPDPALHEKIVFAYGNRTNPTAITSIGTTNITAFASGFPASNLEYEDPWTMAKTNGVTADPLITFNFSANQGAVRACGILNHNLYDQGYTSVDVERWDGVSAWDLLGGASTLGNRDLLITWDSTDSIDQYRVKFYYTGGGGHTDFTVGSIFWGFVNEFTKSPDNGRMIANRTVPIVVEQSAGGAKHVTFGANNRLATLELAWTRAVAADINFFSDNLVIADLVGVLTPDLGDFSTFETYVGNEPFWGYVVDRTLAPVGPGQQNTNPAAAYNYSVFFEGAV